MAKRRRKASRKQKRRHSNPVAVRTSHRRKSYRRRNPVFAGGVKGLWGNLETPLGVAGGFGGIEYLMDKLGLEHGTPMRILAPIVGGYLLSNLEKGQGILRGVGIGVISNGLMEASTTLLSMEFGGKKAVDKKGLGSSMYYDPNTGKIIDMATGQLNSYPSVSGLGNTSSTNYGYKRIEK